PRPTRTGPAPSRVTSTIRRAWRPSVEQIQHARVTEFMRGVAEREGARMTQYEELYEWSVREPQTFWGSFWRFADVRGNRGRRALADAGQMPGARWFPDGELSYAENALRRTDDAPAIVFRREDGARRVVSFAALRAGVGRLQAALRGAGVKPGSHVAACLPNAPEAVEAMLAVASLGATWAACAPDLAPAEAAARLAPLSPRVLLGADGRLVGGERGDGIGPLRDLAAALPSVERTVVLPYMQDTPDIGGVRGGVDWPTFLAGAPGDAPPPSFPRFPFDQPLLVLFPAADPPVGVVHGAGGTLLQHLSELGLHADLRPGAVLLVLATTSWMLWPWLPSALATGATIVLYDGHPFHPAPSALLDVARDERVSVLVVPARYLDAIERAGLRTEKPLPDLRMLLAAGAPVAAERFDTVSQRVKPDMLFSPMWGAPELLSSFALASPMLAVRRGEIPCRALGLRVEVLGPDGQPVTGVSGELACRAPFPGMPVGLSGDADGSRYAAAFFSRHAGAWSQGDRCTLTPHGGLVVHARGETPPAH
ncbi:MAG: AMP-binding protein, partial [Planctomycetales bacterium]|nr:AMP-binding protein [Planctomycetales bacterium]